MSSRKMIGLVILAVLVGFGMYFGFRSSVPTAELTHEAELTPEEVDIYEAAFRHQFAVQGRRWYEGFFISITRNIPDELRYENPPTELLARFGDNDPPVKPISQAISNFDLGYGHSRGARRVMFELGRLKYTGSDTVEVEGSWHENRMFCGGYRYFLSKENATWKVVDSKETWIP